jgi:hypothetical protein
MAIFFFLHPEKSRGASITSCIAVFQLELPLFMSRSSYQDKKLENGAVDVLFNINIILKRSVTALFMGQCSIKYFEQFQPGTPNMAVIIRVTRVIIKYHFTGLITFRNIIPLQIALERDPLYSLWDFFSGTGCTRTSLRVQLICSEVISSSSMSSSAIVSLNHQIQPGLGF